MATYKTLRTGAKMPLVGFGVWKIPNDVCADTVYAALKAGYRLLDCACDYGNEVEVGLGIKRAISEGVITREDIFVTSKLFTTFHAKEHVQLACERTLKDLGLEYLDLYLIHFPIPLKYVPFSVRYPPGWFYDPEGENKVVHENVPVRETWEAMEELVCAGLVKNIGVANWPVALMMDLLRGAKTPPTVCQVELHPYLQQPNLVKFMSSHGIAITAYSSLGGSSYTELKIHHKDPRVSAAEPLMQREEIQSIAQKHCRTPAQVLLRWAVQQGIAVIPKSTNAQRLKENFDVFSFELDEQDLATIAALDRGIRYNNPNDFIDFPLYD